MATLLKFPVPAPKSAPASTSTAKAMSKPVPKPISRRNKRDDNDEDTRKALLARIHILLPQLYRHVYGFDEDVYRGNLRESFGTDSAANLDIGQLRRVAHWLNDRKRQAKLAMPSKTAEKRTAGKKQGTTPATLHHDESGMGREGLMRRIEAFLAEKGGMEGAFIPWEYAEGILRQQTRGRIFKLEHASIRELQAVATALKRDAQRKGRYAGE